MIIRKICKDSSLNICTISALISSIITHLFFGKALSVWGFIGAVCGAALFYIPMRIRILNRKKKGGRNE